MPKAHVGPRSAGTTKLKVRWDRSGRVWRRVKHFSGYYSSAGYKCDPSAPTDTSCQTDDSPLALNASALAGSVVIDFLASVDVSP